MTYATPPKWGCRGRPPAGEKFSRGREISAPRPGRPGAPPGAHFGPPGRASRTPVLGVYIYCFCITQGGIWGVPLGGAFWAPRGGDPPGGQKVHIFLGI